MEKRAMEKEAMETLLSKLTSVSEKWVQSSNSLTYTSDLLIECEVCIFIVTVASRFLIMSTSGVTVILSAN